jgi:hypothetical protein
VVRERVVSRGWECPADERGPCDLGRGEQGEEERERRLPHGRPAQVSGEGGQLSSGEGQGLAGVLAPRGTRDDDEHHDRGEEHPPRGESADPPQGQHRGEDLAHAQQRPCRQRVQTGREPEPQRDQCAGDEHTCGRDDERAVLHRSSASSPPTVPPLSRGRSAGERNRPTRRPASVGGGATTASRLSSRSCSRRCSRWSSPWPCWPPWPSRRSRCRRRRRARCPWPPWPGCHRRSGRGATPST